MAFESNSKSESSEWGAESFEQRFQQYTEAYGDIIESKGLLGSKGSGKHVFFFFFERVNWKKTYFTESETQFRIISVPCCIKVISYSAYWKQKGKQANKQKDPTKQN